MADYLDRSFDVPATARCLEIFTFEWDTTAVSLGVHILESEAMLTGDANPGDNKKTKDMTVNP